MDRLICGDVGYGKTEVALRAAFKAAEDGKQVLMLVPTTILAQQHFGTFSERLRDYPINVEHVSRFRPAREQRAAIKAFARGPGRHPHRHPPPALARRAGEGPRPADRRRGAALRRQAEGAAAPAALEVDVLALSATPIPRTLQMSLAGLRDISVIETPPEGRRPVRTYVGEYDEELVRRRSSASCARDGPGVLPPQPRRDDRRDGRAPARAVPAAPASRSRTASWTRSRSSSGC